MKLEKKNFILNILMVLLVAVTTGVSIRSCRMSENAKITANKAIDISEDSNTIAKEALETVASCGRASQARRGSVIYGSARTRSGIYRSG